MKIIDSFIFYNEIELLYYRLSILNEYVDKFILVESTQTFTGHKKPLFYLENRNMFDKFNDKILYVIVNDIHYKHPNINYNLNHKWKNEYQRVNIGGLSCDNSDYYNAEVNQAQVYLPVIDPDDTEPLYLGFFHTGAYQDSISGYGGIKHCVIPSPKQIVIYRDELGNLVDIMVRPEQTSDEMLKILGY